MSKSKWPRINWNKANIELANKPFEDLFKELGKEARPTIVCLCGSTRFGKAFEQANLEETLAGKIVLSIGCNMRDDDLFVHMTKDERKEIKAKLDELHKRKIDMADEILVLNVDGYIGESTRSEIEYANNSGKRVCWLETPSGYCCEECGYFVPDGGSCFYCENRPEEL